MKVNAYVEYYGKQVHENTMIADVKKAWKKSGHKIGEIKTMDLYIKPEESKDILCDQLKQRVDQ